MMDETGSQTIGDRAKQVRLERHLQQQEIADMLGISLRAWQKMERDEGTPSGETLLQFQRIGINPGWILSGSGPKFDDPSHSPAPSVQVDPQILRQLHRAARLAYLEAGHRPPDEDSLAIEAGQLYNALLEKVADIRETRIVEAVIPVLVDELKSRLAEASANPGTGKRLA
jgi:transcriptional regulator with XRE-family HTH domain